MTYLSPLEKRRRRWSRFRAFLLVIAGFVVFTALDYPLLHLFYYDYDRSIERHDWYRMLRILGFVGTWAVVGTVLVLNDRNRHRGLSVFLSAVLSGILAELAKMVIARERPVEGGIIQSGWYNFRQPFSGFTDGTNLGLPSSHAAVAFGGCMMLAAILPSARRFLFLLAIGCGITRMLTGAHFATDVYLGAVIGTLVALWFTKLTPGLSPKFRRLY
jgi:membrane-associated phospholipid phosphatase